MMIAFYYFIVCKYCGFQPSQCDFNVQYYTVYNRIVAAKKNSKGEVAEVILYSTCADESQTYDAVKDTCT